MFYLYRISVAFDDVRGLRYAGTVSIRTTGPLFIITFINYNKFNHTAIFVILTINLIIISECIEDDDERGLRYAGTVNTTTSGPLFIIIIINFNNFNHTAIFVILFIN